MSEESPTVFTEAKECKYVEIEWMSDFADSLGNGGQIKKTIVLNKSHEMN